MVLALKKEKKQTRRKIDPFDFAAINAEAIAKAKRAGSDIWEPPTLPDEQKTACLERWQHKGKLQGSKLSELEPSGLTERELRDWYWGLRQEAIHRLLCIINSSYSKTEVKNRLQSEGLKNVLSLLDKDLRESYDSVVKYLSN